MLEPLRLWPLSFSLLSLTLFSSPFLCKLRDEFTQTKSKLEHELEEARRNLEHTEGELHVTLQNLNGDMDNKRLSLKYLTETEKREEKKGQFPKVGLAEESSGTK